MIWGIVMIGIHENCGIAGVIGKEAPIKTYLALLGLQHRGQESCGLIVSENGKFHEIKEFGLAITMHKYMDIIDELRGPTIGHVRYSTYGENSKDFIQPIRAKYRDLELYLAHNGTIPNAFEFISFLERNRVKTNLKLDSGVLAGLLAYGIWEYDLIEGVKFVQNNVKAAYSAVTLLPDDSILAFKDRYGIRPLSIAISKENVVLSSEDCVFNAIFDDNYFSREFLPGEAIVVDKTLKLRSINSGNINEERICSFEYVYFARPDSTISSVNVYNTRLRMGMILAEEELKRFKEPLGDLIVPVPDSGRTAARGFAYKLNLPLDEGLIKNRYIGRTFILPTQRLRRLGVRIKLSPIKDVIEDRRVYLIDDSIVRGTTMKEIVEIVRIAGASEVHVRIASPPVRHPCYFGIDFPTKEELLANTLDIEEITDMIGADTVYYLSLDGLKKAIGKEGVCTGCFSGMYPIEVDKHGKIKIPRSR